MNDIHPEFKTLLDGAAASVAVLGVIMVENLNEMLLLATLVWTILRIWETDTVRRVRGKKKEDNGEET